MTVETLEINEVELASIDDYRRKTDTAVLTIMFTDIQGFTNITEIRGDEFANKLRHAHDSILTNEITKDQAGIVVKHIGDAVMAVFSEPTAAIKAALEIQEKLNDINQFDSLEEKLLVRIGLHLGQVTIENQMRPDIFGRHVNRCSRIEGAADGGQVFVSYNVFDAAKGWLVAEAGTDWRDHGFYYLKGINEAVQLFEIKNKGQGEFRPPAKVRKKRNTPKIAVGIGLLVAGMAVSYAVNKYQQTNVWIKNPPREQMLLNGEEKIVLKGNRVGDAKLVHTNIPIGSHLLQVNINNAIRNFAKIEVKRGENHLHPYFESARLPRLNRRLSLRDEAFVEFNVKRNFEFFVYDEKLNRLARQATILITGKGESSADDGDLVKFVLDIEILEEGKSLVTKSLELEHRKSADSKRSPGKTTLVKSSHYEYIYKYYLTYDTVDIDIEGHFYKSRSLKVSSN